MNPDNPMLNLDHVVALARETRQTFENAVNSKANEMLIAHIERLQPVVRGEVGLTDFLCELSDEESRFFFSSALATIAGVYAGRLLTAAASVR